MKILLICFLVTPLIATGYDPAKSWFNYNFYPDTIRVKEVNKVPDQNSYKWLKYIDQQCGNIALNPHVALNNSYYQAMINKKTKQTHKKLKQYFRLSAQLLLSGILYSVGCALFYICAHELHKEPIKKHKRKNNADVEMPPFALVPPAFFCYSVATFLLYKTIKQRSTLKKILKRNTRMLASLETTVL